MSLTFATSSSLSITFAPHAAARRPPPAARLYALDYAIWNMLAFVAMQPEAVVSNVAAVTALAHKQVETAPAAFHSQRTSVVAVAGCWLLAAGSSGFAVSLCSRTFSPHFFTQLQLSYYFIYLFLSPFKVYSTLLVTKTNPCICFAAVTASFVLRFLTFCWPQNFICTISIKKTMQRHKLGNQRTYAHTYIQTHTLKRCFFCLPQASVRIPFFVHFV